MCKNTPLNTQSEMKLKLVCDSGSKEKELVEVNKLSSSGTAAYCSYLSQ